MELVEYHGGSQRGNLRIPEGRRGVGWVKFESELRRYFLTKIDSSSVPSAGDGQAGMVRRSALGIRNQVRCNDRNSNFHSTMETRDPRGGDKSMNLAPRFQPRESCQKILEKEVNPRVQMSTSEPRPTASLNLSGILTQILSGSLRWKLGLEKWLGFSPIES